MLSNRWPVLTDLQFEDNDGTGNPGANFPGAQTHPMHMHGHSFYVLAEDLGTVRDPVRL